MNQANGTISFRLGDLRTNQAIDPDKVYWLGFSSSFSATQYRVQAYMCDTQVGLSGAVFGSSDVCRLPVYYHTGPSTTTPAILQRGSLGGQDFSYGQLGSYHGKTIHGAFENVDYQILETRPADPQSSGIQARRWQLYRQVGGGPLEPVNTPIPGDERDFIFTAPAYAPNTTYLVHCLTFNDRGIPSPLPTLASLSADTIVIQVGPNKTKDRQLCRSGHGLFEWWRRIPGL